MNIEIANRLVNLRKSNSYSQEALAEKLGISRQAVSKWERAEASPDTDNLILLARLYGVSLDELLATDEEIPKAEPAVETMTAEKDTDGEDDGFDRVYGNASGQDSREEYVHIGFRGIHVREKDGSEVHVGWNGIHVDDRKRNDNVHIDKNGVFVNGKPYDKHWFSSYYPHLFPMTLLITVIYCVLGAVFNFWHPGWLIFLVIPIWYSLLDTIHKKDVHLYQKIPMAVLILVIYVAIGVLYSLWHPGWLLLLLIPVWYSFVEAVHKRNAHYFAYPVLMVLLFLLSVFFMGRVHPTWVIFITIPLYYSMVAYIQGKLGSKENKKDVQGGEDEVAEDQTNG